MNVLLNINYNRIILIIAKCTHVSSPQCVYTFDIIFDSGLLGGHTMAEYLSKRNLALPRYNNELLEMAKDIGDRLLPAFNTSTGIPYPRVSSLCRHHYNSLCYICMQRFVCNIAITVICVIICLHD